MERVDPGSMPEPTEGVAGYQHEFGRVRNQAALSECGICSLELPLIVVRAPVRFGGAKRGVGKG